MFKMRENTKNKPDGRHPLPKRLRLRGGTGLADTGNMACRITVSRPSPGNAVTKNSGKSRRKGDAEQNL